MENQEEQPEQIVTELPPQSEVPAAPPTYVPAAESPGSPPGPFRWLGGLIFVLGITALGTWLLYILFLRHRVDGVREWFGF